MEKVNIFEKAIQMIVDNVTGNNLEIWEFTSEKPDELLVSLGYIGGVLDLAREIVRDKTDA